LQCRWCFSARSRY
jgi:hypothetical protein